MSTRDDATATASASNPSVRFALEKLCAGEKQSEEGEQHKKQGVRPASLQSLEPVEQSGGQNAGQSVAFYEKTASLQSLSPNEQQLPQGTEPHSKQTLRSSRYRPLSLLVRTCNNASDDSDKGEDQATFEDCFFDLLFSASLSVYGTAANLTSIDQVGQFMSFFALLWWSWWCQTLYDVRYRSRHHSGLFAICAHRAIRISLLGTWVAFSTCASEYSQGTYTSFSLVYSLTRASLLLDHLVSSLDPPPTRRIYPSKEKKASRFLCHFTSLAATTFSLLCWVASRYLSQKRIDGSMRPVVYSIWVVSVLAEMVSQIYVEKFGPFDSLSSTQLVERLALFSLIIFGGGYENIGLALNAISPRQMSKTSYPGHWRFATVLNAISAVAIIMFLFFGYFKRAVKRLKARPVVVLTWSYLHILLHIASAVLVVGLSKVISFSNTAEALKDFDLHPMRYLPDTAQWHAFAQSHFPTHVDFDSIPQVSNITDLYEFQVAAIQLSILATQGAIVPSAQQAALLIHSTQVLHGMTWPSALQNQMSAYFDLVSSVEDPQAAQDYVSNNLFQFFYVFFCAGVYMLTDVVLKAMQGIGDMPLNKKAAFWSMSIRTSFAVLLGLTQVAYIKLHERLPNFGLITYVLPALAGLLLAESLIQSCINNARYWTSQVVKAANEKRQEMTKVRNVPRR